MDASRKITSERIALPDSRSNGAERFEMRFHFPHRRREDDLAFQLTFETRHVVFVFGIKINYFCVHWSIRSG